jgi:hypothetical protein
MGMNTSLRIALYEENPRLLVLLRSILLLAGHSVSTCYKVGYPLATFLQELVEEQRHPYIPYYDLYIIDVSDIRLSDEILTPLEFLLREQSLPILLLAEPDQPIFELLKAKATIVPVLFHTVLSMQDLFSAIESMMGMLFPLSASELRLIQQLQREHFQETIHAEQTWITTRRAWLNQRQDWLTQRQQWLTQRMMWIIQQREHPDPQLEWLDAQRDWLVQQQEEVKQLQRWEQQHWYWLEQRQRRLDQLLHWHSE